MLAKDKLLPLTYPRLIRIRYSPLLFIKSGDNSVEMWIKDISSRHVQCLFITARAIF